MVLPRSSGSSHCTDHADLIRMWCSNWKRSFSLLKAFWVKFTHYGDTFFMVLAQPTFHPFKDFLYFCNQEGVITQLLSSALPIFCAQRGNNPSKRVTHFSRYGKMHFKVPFFFYKSLSSAEKCPFCCWLSYACPYRRFLWSVVYQFFFGYEICCMLEIFVIAIFAMRCTKRVTFREKTPF